MTTETKTLMRQEIEEIPEAVERLLSLGHTERRKSAEAARELNPRLIVTVARGSSDHVCTYLKYVSELLLGIPVASVGPSVASVYGVRLKLKHSLGITISQSGQSPDIVEMTKSAVRDGARTIAITNNAASPLADSADQLLCIHAGPERSVAATKTFVNSAVAGLAFLAEWKQDRALQDAIAGLPEKLTRAVCYDWPELRESMSNTTSLYSIGRGPAWAIANEAALKFKETCQLHAESFSSAEILHGPVSIVGEKFPVLAFASGDQAEKGLAQVADKIARMGANVFITSGKSTVAKCMEHVRTGHPLTDPLALIVSFYAMVEKLALDRGVNPDMPRHLHKVTETV